MTHNDRAGVSDSPTLPWIIACVTLCLLVVVYRLASKQLLPGALAYQIGYNLPGALIFAGLLHLAFRKKVSVQIGWLGFGLIFASMVSATVVVAKRQKTGMRQAATEMRATLDNVRSSIDSGKDSALPLTTSAEGDAGKMSVAVKTMLNTMLAQRRAYDQELEGTGWSKVLDPARIEGDKQMNETRTIVRQAREVMDKYAGKTDDLFARMRADIEKSNVSAESKESMLAGFNKTEAKSKSNAKAIWKLEGQALDEVEKAVTLLGSTRGHWLIENGQFAFQRQEDLDRFNAHMTKVQQLAADQQAIQNAALQKAQDKMQEIGK